MDPYNVTGQRMSRLNHQTDHIPSGDAAAANGLSTVAANRLWTVAANRLWTAPIAWTGIGPSPTPARPSQCLLLLATPDALDYKANLSSDRLQFRSRRHRQGLVNPCKLREID